MATILRNPKVGDYVYEHCKPQRSGKIVRITKGKIGPECTVKWCNGTESIIPDGTYLKDFKALLEDCRRKVRTHETTLDRLKGL